MCEDGCVTDWSHSPGYARSHAHRLGTHVKGVTHHMHDSLTGTPSLADGTDSETLIESVVSCHDIGKLTPWFQEHLGNPMVTPAAPTHRTSRNHAAIGAAATWYALTKLDRDVTAHAKLVATTAVLRHHNPYPDLQHDVYTRFIDNDVLWSETFPEQVKAIDKLNGDTAAVLMRDATNGNGSWEDFRNQIMRESLKDLLNGEFGDGNNTPLSPSLALSQSHVSKDTYIDVLRVWSALTAADARDASNITTTPEVPHPDVKPGAVTNHINDLPDAGSDLEQSLNKQRAAARTEALTRVESIPDETNILQLTLPTGLGKTLTSISAALKYREENTVPETTAQNIIYALPYTSIIEQTAETLTDVFNTDPSGGKLTVHHHLRETTTEVENEQYTSDSEHLLGESWLTDLTVTTFVQLFESLTGPVKRESYKLSQLHNSIIILDEPQALPIDWWPVITTLVEYLDQEFNATIVYLTATQPALTDTHDTYNLIETPDTYATTHPRTQYLIHESLDRGLTTGINIPDAATEVSTTVTTGDKDTLCVCNTITSARTLYGEMVSELTSQDTEKEVCELNEMLAETLEQIDATTLTEDGRAEIVEAFTARFENRDAGIIACQLTSRHRPCDRSLLIALIDELLDSEHTVVVISTQVVEAGVDLSFTAVYRDFAPMDSIVQAAGRCNREYENGVEGGTVTVWQLQNDAGEMPCNYVYGIPGVNRVDVAYIALESVIDSSVCDLTSPVTVSESVFHDAVSEYHAELQDRRPKTNGLVTAFENVDGRTLGSASMIESTGSVQVMLPVTESESQNLHELHDAVDRVRAGVDGAYEEYQALLKDAQQYTVSLPVRGDTAGKIESLPTVQIVNIPFVDGCSEWFSAVDGGDIPESTVDNRIL